MKNWYTIVLSVWILYFFLHKYKYCSKNCVIVIPIFGGGVIQLRTISFKHPPVMD